MKWYLKVLQNYFTFSGRARRSEYWYFVLFNCIFTILAMVVDNILGTTFQIGDIPIPYGYIYVLYALGLLIPGLAVMVRRLHDVGKSGWMFFVVLIPIIGSIWISVLLCKDSVPDENKYGLNPKLVEV